MFRDFDFTIFFTKTLMPNDSHIFRVYRSNKCFDDMSNYIAVTLSQQMHKRMLYFGNSFRLIIILLNLEKKSQNVFRSIQSFFNCSTFEQILRTGI